MGENRESHRESRRNGSRRRGRLARGSWFAKYRQCVGLFCPSH
jgi:hypothetical protein